MISVAFDNSVKIIVLKVLFPKKNKINILSLLAYYSFFIVSVEHFIEILTVR